MILDLIQDYHDAVAAMPREHLEYRRLELLEEVIRRDSHFIDRHPTALFQCMWNTCWWFDCTNAGQHYDPPDGGWPTPLPWRRTSPKLCDLLQAWHEGKTVATPEFIWLRSLRPPPLQLGGGQVLVMKGHEGRVTGVAWSPCGNLIASGSQDGMVRLWNVETGQEMQRMQGHKEAVTSVTFSPDGQYIASSSADRTVRIYEVITGREQRCFRGHVDTVNDVAYLPDGSRIVSGSDEKVLVWNVMTGACLATLTGHSDLEALACLADGRRIAVASKHDRKVHIWDTKTGKHLSLHGHKDGVSDVAATSDPVIVVSGGRDSTVRVWNVETAKQLNCIKLSEPVRSVAVSSDPNFFRIVSGCGYSMSNAGNTIRIFNGSNGQELRCFRGNSGLVWSVMYSPDGRLPASGSDDGSVRVWNTSVDVESGNLRGHRDDINALCFSPDGQQVSSGSGDRTLRLWQVQSGVEQHCLRGHSNRIFRITYSPNSRFVISDSIDGTSLMWDAKSGVAVRKLRERIESIAYSPDSQRMVMGWPQCEGSAIVCDVPSGGNELVLHGHKKYVCSVACSPDGRYVATGSGDGSLRVWDASNGVQLACLSGHRWMVNSCEFSEDGHFILSEDSDYTVRLWEVKNNREILCLRRRTASYGKIALSSRGDRIFTVDRDHSYSDSVTRIWCATSGKCIKVLPGERDVSAIAKDMPWSAFAFQSETVIEELEKQKIVTWLSEALHSVVTHPTGRIWAGGVGNYVCIIMLEGRFKP